MRTTLGLVCCLLALSLGCADEKKSGDSQAHDGDQHAHDHGHDDEGPHGGHLIELNKDTYHLEWLHDDESGKVTVFVLDSAAKQAAPIAAEQILITTAVTGGASQTYTLLPVKADPGQTATAEFELVSAELIGALQVAGKGVDAEVQFTVGEETYTGEIEHASHAGHSH